MPPQKCLRVLCFSVPQGRRRWRHQMTRLSTSSRREGLGQNPQALLVVPMLPILGPTGNPNVPLFTTPDCALENALKHDRLLHAKGGTLRMNVF